ncbi:MAG: arylsulfatase [Candidatus Hydrogenedentes bacterium]|nr:arylsulfatase [Candidatus Hydrogenedentota bacterium]
MTKAPFHIRALATCCITFCSFGAVVTGAPPVAGAQTTDVDSAGDTRPNIVYILADDLGYGDLSCLNENSKINTPHIDRLARAGMIFTDAHSGSALCTPTRYGILTGRYAWRTRLKRGVLWGYSRHLIEPDRMTVASLLSAGGYNTACIGKWHLGMDLPTKDGKAVGEGGLNVDRRGYIANVDWRGTIENGPLSIGFDYFYGISASLDMHPFIYIQNDRFVGECTTEKDFLSFDGNNNGPAHEDFEAIDVLPEITRKTVQYIEAQSKDRPFFVYMPLSAPHIPIVPSKEYQGRSSLGAYGDFVIQVDDAVGQVLNALDRKGFAEDTLVVFTADNGCAPYIGVEAMIEKGHYPSYVYRGYKSDIFEGGHRIPFIVRWPTKVDAGTKSDETICLTDLMATCASITGAKLPDNAGEDSYDILPALLGEPRNQPIREATVHHAGDGSFSIRQGKWKLALCPGSGGWSPPTQAEARKRNLPPLQLYDLEQDIAEKVNVYQEHPDVVKELSALLEKYKKEGRSVVGR